MSQGHEEKATQTAGEGRGGLRSQRPGQALKDNWGLEDKLEGVPEGEVVAVADGARVVCCEEHELGARDRGPSPDTESDDKEPHLPESWLVPHGKADGLHHCSQAWHSWSRGCDVSMAEALGQCRAGAGDGPEEGSRGPTWRPQRPGQADWMLLRSCGQLQAGQPPEQRADVQSRLWRMERRR